MLNELNETGLYWHPLGGNNIDQISGHCYHYMDISKNEEGKINKTSIIIDIGKFDNHSALGIENSSASIPDVRFLLQDDNNRAQAIFLTHSHPDHINGLVHYIKAGYKLPRIYSGMYTFMILKGLFEYFNIPEDMFPELVLIRDGDTIKIGNIKVEAISSSHTCFDSLGFIIESDNASVYHTGDMKIDNSTYFRKPTNIKRLKELKGSIDFVVADFCQVFKSGQTPREVDTFKKMVTHMKKCRKSKVFIPVYPTHPEMYIIAFLAALKMKKNVIFCGSGDFYSYLDLITKYEISFDKIAKNRIKILYKPDGEINQLEDNYVVIGDFRKIGPVFEANDKNSFGIITSKNIFNPLRKELKNNNISFIDVNSVPELQGYGHGFIEDYKYINSILAKPIFIPSHCPAFVVENFQELAKVVGINMVEYIPINNGLYKMSKNGCQLVKSMPAKWLVVIYDDTIAKFVETPQIPTAGKGSLRSTISKRRSFIHAKECINIEKKGNVL